MMFLDNLSMSLRQLCEIKQLTYEDAADLCDISIRFFGDIVRKKRCPSLKTLEKICIGFQKKPNELLQIDAAKWSAICAARRKDTARSSTGKKNVL